MVWDTEEERQGVPIIAMPFKVKAMQEWVREKEMAHAMRIMKQPVSGLLILVAVDLISPVVEEIMVVEPRGVFLGMEAVRPLLKQDSPMEYRTYLFFSLDLEEGAFGTEVPVIRVQEVTEEEFFILGH